jgi:hypothetical protein
LKSSLVQIAGLPRTRPAVASSGFWSSGTMVGLPAAVVLVLGLGGLGVALARRRARPPTA